MDSSNRPEVTEPIVVSQLRALPPWRRALLFRIRVVSFVAFFVIRDLNYINLVAARLS